MFHILGFLFIIIIAILIIGLSLIGTVLRSLFGLGGRRSSQSRPYTDGSYRTGGSYSTDNRRTSASSNGEVTPEEGELHPKRKKLFSKEEGEYVNFEEIN